MRIDVSAPSGLIPLPRFVIHAESVSDRAILGIFTNAKFTDGLQLGIGGSTYSCDLSGTTAFNFGWIDIWHEMPAPRVKDTLLVCRAGEPESVRPWFASDNESYVGPEQAGFTHWMNLWVPAK